MVISSITLNTAIIKETRLKQVTDSAWQQYKQGVQCYRLHTWDRGSVVLSNRSPTFTPQWHQNSQCGDKQWLTNLKLCSSYKLLYLPHGKEATHIEKIEIHSPCSRWQCHGPSNLVHICHISLQQYWEGRYSGHWRDRSYYQNANTHRLHGRQKKNKAEEKLPLYVTPGEQTLTGLGSFHQSLYHAVNSQLSVDTVGQER